MTEQLQEENRKTEEQAKIRKIDFKMVSFTLAGRDYGIDIMKVKEIRKAGNFTYVPNTPLFVRGVDNLRGDIISIIDLRIMFNLPAPKNPEGTLENIIILRIDELIIGIVVDTIEKVLGISKESIQAPHPIFGDINVKYISGIVEHDERLYIILDVDKIFNQNKQEDKPLTVDIPPGETLPSRTQRPLGSQEDVGPSRDQASRTSAEHYSQDPKAKSHEPDQELKIQFISETLQTFRNFHASPLNRNWLEKRLVEWEKECQKKSREIQLESPEDADSFLTGFLSPENDRLWDPAYLESLFSLLDIHDNQVIFWNPGCGRGLETYSLACGCRHYLKAKNYKIWASDNDLLNISMAPSLAFKADEVNDFYRSYTLEAKNGLQFNQDIKSMILFEFHDINNMNPFTDVHLIVARDILSYLGPQDQERVLGEFHDKVRKNGYLLLGANESLPGTTDWKLISDKGFHLYQKNT